MPYYTHQCDACDHVEEIYLKIGERDTCVGKPCPVEVCPGKLFRGVEAPGFTTSESLGRIKAPAEFRDVLKNIAKENPGNTIPLR